MLISHAGLLKVILVNQGMCYTGAFESLSWISKNGTLLGRNKMGAGNSFGNRKGRVSKPF